MEYEILMSDGNVVFAHGKKEMMATVVYILYETEYFVVKIWKNRKRDGTNFDITNEILPNLKFM